MFNQTTNPGVYGWLLYKQAKQKHIAQCGAQTHNPEIKSFILY